MKSRSLILLMIIMLLVIVSLFQGCGEKRIVELKKEKLFTIPIGRGEEQIGILRQKNGRYLGPNYVLFKNGFFFVVDSVNQKVMKITTPGDIILIISKGDGESDQEENVLRTKERKYYSFDQIGHLAVDNENNIFVEDIFLEKTKVNSVIDIITFDEGSEEEEEYKESYMSYIVKFDRLGNFLYKIGKNGVDSDPFYYVYKTDIDMDGNLIVLTGNDEWDNWTCYRFDSDGKLMGKRTIKKEEIVSNEDLEDRSYFILDVLPAVGSDKLVFWVSQYDTAHDTRSVKKEKDLWGEEIEIENLDSSKAEEKKPETKMMNDLLYYRLLYYNLDSGSIDTSYTWETNYGNQFESTEEFLGIDEQSDGFLWKYVDKNSSIITIFRPDGTIIAKRSFVFEDDGIWTNLNVAIDGSVSAIKVDDQNIYFYRWRSDKLIHNKREKVTVKEFISEKIEEFKNANR